MKKQYIKPEIRVIQLSSFPLLTASQYGTGGGHNEEIRGTDDFDEFEMG